MRTFIKAVGNWLVTHQKLIRRLQWFIILVYAFLILVPATLPLPDDSARLFHNLTVFSQFLFWGVWWPFVLLSMVLFGRLWCGTMCPEGTLSELANNYGRGKTIPRWIRWRGWPFLSFTLVTIYGQLTSVYQYPKPVLVILGGSTLAAMVIGFLYGRSSRVWCRYLCPVTGVFALLTRLSPLHYKTDQNKWNSYEGEKLIIHCPTLISLKKMKNANSCLMCGKCNNFRAAIALTPRSPNEEIVKNGVKEVNLWESLLIIFGLCGIALGAFQWSTSFWFNHWRDVVDSWFLMHNILWVFNMHLPWWIFTNYPERHDQFSWMFGIEVLSYIVIFALFSGTLISSLLAFAVRLFGKFKPECFYHLSLSLIPLAGCGVFVGLLANTFTDLEKYANIGFTWTNELKALLLIAASLWSMLLASKIINRYTTIAWRRMISFLCLLIILVLIDYFWVLMLHVWVIKSDSVPWNTFWVTFL